MYMDESDFFYFSENFHKETYNWNALAIIGVLCGDLRGTIEYAASNNKLNTALLCLAPSISNRFYYF